MDLGDVVAVTKIATQGLQEAPQWVTEFKVSYSFDGGYFKFCQQAPNNTFDQVRCADNTKILRLHEVFCTKVLQGKQNVPPLFLLKTVSYIDRYIPPILLFI